MKTDLPEKNPPGPETPEKTAGSRWLAGSAGLVTALIGVVVLLAWQQGWQQALAFGASYYPTAPLSGTWFVLIGGGLCLVVLRPGPRSALAGFIIAATAVLFGCAVLLNNALTTPEFWHDFEARLRFVPLSQVANSTALELILAGLALGVPCTRYARTAVGRLLPGIAALLGLIVALFITLHYLVRVPLVPNETSTLPMAFLTALTLVVLQGGLLLANSITLLRALWLGAFGQVHETTQAEWRVSRRTLAGFVALIGCCVLGAFFYLRSNLADERRAVQEQLDSIAGLKTSQIVAWRAERYNDARALAAWPTLTEFLGGEARDAATAAAQAGHFGAVVENWLKIYGYEQCVVFDRELRPVTSFPAGRRIDREISAAARSRLLQAWDVVDDDLHRGKDGHVHWDLLVPKRTPDGAFLGAVLLVVNAETGLFPILQNWPVPSETAETLLVRRDGAHLVYLTPLRRAPDAPLRLRRPGTDPALLAAQALRHQLRGLGEGVDYAGVPAVGVALPVPNTGWTVITKMDRAEAFALVRVESQQVAAISGLLLTLALLVGRSWWQARQRSQILRQLDTERERRAASERLALVMEQANDVILLLDENMHVIEANQRVREVYGWTPEEICRLTTWDLRAPELRAGASAQFAKAMTEGGVRFETRHVRKDGTVFPVEVSSRMVKLGGARHVLSIVRDISERQRLMDEVARHEAKLRLVIEQAPVGISFSSSLSGQIELTNSEHARLTGVPAERANEPGIFAKASHPDDYARQMEAAKAFIEGRENSYRIEKRYLHPDGHVQWVELNSRFYIDPINGDKKSITTLTDIAQRKAHQEEIERLSQLYRIASEVNKMIVRSKNREQLFGEVCRLLVAEGRFLIAWIGCRNPQTQRIEPVAVAGDEHGYVASIRVSADPTLPEGRGPSGRAFRENRTVVVHDFLAESATAPWHELAARRGLKTSICLPLRCAGWVEGVLMVYGSEVGYFAQRNVTLLEETAEDVSFALEIFAARQQLEKNETALRLALASVDMALFQQDRELRYTWMYSPQLGYTSAQVIGRTDAELLPAADEPAVTAIKRRVLETGRGEMTEVSVRPNGGLHIYALTVEPNRDATGAIIGITGSSLDITALKRMEGQLRQLSQVVEQSPLSILITSLRGAIEYANPHFIAATGYTMEELRGQDLRLFKSDLWERAVLRKMWRTIATGGTWSGEVVNRRKNGELYPVHVTIAPVRDAQGRPSHYAAVMQDMSELLRSRLELEKSEAKFRRLLQMVPLPLGHSDATGGITFTNQRFRRQFGYTPEDVPTIAAWERLAYPDPQYRATVTEQWLQAVRRAEPGGRDIEAVEARVTCKDGQERIVEISGIVLGEELLVVFMDITERRRSEARLRQLSRTVEQAPLSIAITNLDGIIDYVNPAFLATTGYTREEVIGQNPRVLKSGQVPPEVYRDMWAALRRGEVWRGELRNRKKNGEIYDELVVIAPVTDDDGRITHYVALKEDITERRRLEESVRESEQRFRTLFESSLDGFVLTNPTTGEVLAANAAACEVFRCSAEEILLRGRSGLTDGNDPRLAALIEERARNGRARGEVTMVRADGTRFEVELASSLFLIKGETRAGLVVRDITERKRAQQRLERFNQELEESVIQRTAEIAARNREIEALLQSIPDTVVHMRRDGVVVSAKQAKGETPLAQHACYAPAGVADTPFAAALRAAALAAGRQALATGASVVTETELSTGAEVVDLELRATAIGSEEFVAFIRDITARKHFEAETAAMLAREREISEMKTRFISVTSHEFRTPMAAIHGSVDLLANHLDRLPAAKRQELFNRITVSLGRMTSMLDDVLTLNRIDAKRTKITPEAINFTAWATNLVEEIQLADRGAHRIEFHASGDTAHVVTDVAILHHIVSNLLSNAVRYSPAGTLITLQAAAAETLTVSVRDQGIGIPEPDRARIFEPFERGSNVGTIRGTGLGLNIVKRMVELLGGTVALAAGPDGGSCFTVVLPKLKLPAAP